MICIFCKSADNTFNSIEHVFPESLGNTEIFLPKGFVCDICNNESLSGLDEELLEFEPIKFFRTFYGIKSKKGKVPVTSLPNIKIENPNRDHVHLTVSSHKFITNKSKDGFDLKFTSNRKIDSKRTRLIARALYKIALELLCLDHGNEFILSNRFDQVREIILGKQPEFNGYLLVGTEDGTKPSGVSYRFLKDEHGQEFAFFEFNYFQITIFFDFEIRKSVLANRDRLEKFTVLKF